MNHALHIKRYTYHVLQALFVFIMVISLKCSFDTIVQTTDSYYSLPILSLL